MSEYIDLRLIDGTLYPVTFKDGKEYETMFPNINVAQEFCAMHVWLEHNPQRRKTRRGIRRFIAGWLIRATQQAMTPLAVQREAKVGIRGNY